MPVEMCIIVYHDILCYTLDLVSTIHVCFINLRFVKLLIEQVPSNRDVDKIVNFISKVLPVA